MHAHRSTAVLGLSLVLVTASGGWALIPGGHLARSDCLAGWRVTTRSVAPTRGMSALDCQDGDPRCDADGRGDGVCTFNVSVCVGESDPRRPDCRAPATMPRFRRLTGGIEPPAATSAPACGRATPVFVHLRTKKDGRRAPSKRLRLRMLTTADGVRDVDRLVLRCMPAPRGAVQAAECPPNPRGPDEPNELVLTAFGIGPDLDLGWTGAGHDLLVPGNTTLRVCLEGCDRAEEPVCETRIVTGPGTANGTLFGPPLPFVAAGVPICLVKEYDGTLFTGGTADLSTGALETTIGLRAGMFVTDAARVCPRCREGRCDGGANDGGACAVDVSLRVPGGDEPARYDLSRDCPPDEAALVGAMSLDLPLTTGTSVLEPLPGGETERPCVAQAGEPSGVPPEPDGCAGACDAECTGDACAVSSTEPVTGASVCLAARGGIGQVCCAHDTTRPCFPTPLLRSGRAGRPMPPWPRASYPKQSGLIAVATFCAAATGTETIDTVLGLPGPGALVLPATATWGTPTPSEDDGGDGGGEVPAPY